MRSQFSMGLFPEITRAWVVIDSDIFMWNYETNDDLAYFDAIENTVLKIALARVKSDVFAINLDSASLNDIVSTNNGRIFFTADDKLYEFVYEVFDLGVDGAQCSRVCVVTAGQIAALHYQPPEPGMIARVQPHAFYRQSIEMKQRLIICSNEVRFTKFPFIFMVQLKGQFKGIHEFDYVTPRDALREALFDGGAEGRATVQLWQQFGATEVLVLALSVLTSELAVDERIKEKAASIFYSFKDTPELVDVEQTRGLESTWSPGDSIAEWKHKMRCTGLFAQ
ncbi:hypothetical protein TELCIR_11429 [Teladorsagia circumcincta]|uniref:Nucleoporin Nup133/Nup155-like N-terminal domain-containing protein n=1 Tax=Teladorsagia circumcincta TaxID=45464 RepID=A0A2G9U9F1_TELCI|nr:hypothetical protein TELCIR_11429 [Teladorsagia circumcincta]